MPTPASSSGAALALPALRRALLAVVDLAVPLTCGGCGTHGHRWCPACRAEIEAPTLADHLDEPGAPGRPPTWAAHDYEGAVAAAVVAYKDGERRDLVDGLDVQLAMSLFSALDALEPVAGPVAIVPVPASRASRRRRGDAPLEPLAKAAVRHVEDHLGPGRVLWAPVLRVARRVEDQAHLSARERAANVSQAYDVRSGFAGLAGRGRPEDLAGRACVVVDDVTTTGATLAEAARALTAAGAGPIHAAVIAATRRRRADSATSLPLRAPVD